MDEEQEREEEEQQSQDPYDQKLQEDQVNSFYDLEERRAREDFLAGTRRTPLGTNILLMLGRLIEPQTTGYPQVNLDMSFSNLSDWDLFACRGSSFVINFCRLHNLKKAEYMERGNLATILNTAKSHRAKTMDLFTTTVTTQKQEYKDITQKKTGFLSNLGLKKRKEA